MREIGLILGFRRTRFFESVSDKLSYQCESLFISSQVFLHGLRAALDAVIKINSSSPQQKHQESGLDLPF